MAQIVGTDGSERSQTLEDTAVSVFQATRDQLQGQDRGVRYNCCRHTGNDAGRCRENRRPGFPSLQTLQPGEVPDTAPFSTRTTQERLLPVRACGYGQLNVYIIDS